MVTFANPGADNSSSIAATDELPRSFNRGALRSDLLRSDRKTVVDEDNRSPSVERSRRLDALERDNADTKRGGKVVTFTIPPGEKYEVSYHRVTERGERTNGTFSLKPDSSGKLSPTAAGQISSELLPDGSTKVSVTTWGKKHNQVGLCQAAAQNEEFRGYLTVTTGKGKPTLHVNVGNGHGNAHLKQAPLWESVANTEGVTSNHTAAAVDRQVSSPAEVQKRDNVGPGVVLPEKNSTFSAKNPATFQMDENGVLTVYHGQLLNSLRVGESLRKGTVAAFVPPTTPHELRAHKELVAKPGPFRGMEVRLDNRLGAPANQFLIWPTGDEASGSYVLTAARIGDETNRVAHTIIQAGVGVTPAVPLNQKTSDVEISLASPPSLNGKVGVQSVSREEEEALNQPSPSDRIVLPGPIEVELGAGETLCLHYKTFGPDGKERARSLSAHAIRPDTVSTTIPGVGKITRVKDPSGRDVVRIEPMEGFSGEISTRPSTAKEATIHPFKDYRRGEPAASSHLVSKER